MFSLNINNLWLFKVLTNDTSIYSQPVVQILQSRVNVIYKSGDLIWINTSNFVNHLLLLWDFWRINSTSSQCSTKVMTWRKKVQDRAAILGPLGLLWLPRTIYLVRFVALPTEPDTRFFLWLTSQSLNMTNFIDRTSNSFCVCTKSTNVSQLCLMGQWGLLFPLPQHHCSIWY